MKLETFDDLYVDHLRDLYSAEMQLTKALPKLAKAAASPELQNAFREHLEQTEEHVTRLKSLFEKRKLQPSGKDCKAMEGLIKEGEEFIKEHGRAAPAVLDAGLIASAQKVEHYEIASYGTARSFAKLLGDDTAAKLLQKSLDEEGECDKELTSISESINVEAVETVKT
jgi:ferritin-like metal-binding protein YciE